MDVTQHVDNSPQGCDVRWRTKRAWLAHARELEPVAPHRRWRCRR